MRKIDRLTALQVKRLSKPGLYADGGNLLLQVAKGGSKSWLFRFARNGRTRDMGLGSIITVGLAEARERAKEARRSLLDGKDPIEVRRASRASAAKVITFDQAADQYIASNRAGWRNPRHGEQWEATIRRFASPIIGSMPVNTIQVSDVMRVLGGDLWVKRTVTASRLRGRIEAVLDWAKVRGYRDGPNAALWKGNLQALLPAPKRVSKPAHHAALDYREIPSVMKDLRARDGVAARALELCILAANRTSETLGAKWTEIDLDEKLWIVEASRTKAHKEHRIPLSGRAIEILTEMAAIRQGEHVFPGRRGRTLDKDTLAVMLSRMGRTETVHGFRATFSTWSATETHFSREVREMALGHAVGTAVEQAYQRGDMFQKRRALMEAWAAYCQPSGERGKVIAFG
jgi:integrase